RRPPRPPASADAGGVHAAQLLLQVGDLVAEPGGELELQVAGRGEHLVGQLLDEVGQFGARHALGVAAGDDAGADRGRGPTGLARGALAAGLGAPGTADRDLLALLGLAVDLVEDVGDLLAQRLRVDAVGLVVGDLLRAAAVGLVDGVLHRLGDRV